LLYGKTQVRSPPHSLCASGAMLLARCRRFRSHGTHTDASLSPSPSTSTDVEAAAFVSLRKSKYSRQRVCCSSHGFVVAQKWWT
jgi:hypothetical protein